MEKKINWAGIAMLLLGIAFLIIGITMGQQIDVLQKATRICLECVGIG